MSGRLSTKTVEYKTVYVPTSVNFICPLCGKPVREMDEDAAWEIIGKGRSKRKQWFYEHCREENTYGNY